MASTSYYTIAADPHVDDEQDSSTPTMKTTKQSTTLPTQAHVKHHSPSLHYR